MSRPARLGLTSLVVGAAGAAVLIRTFARRVPIASPTREPIEVRRAITVDASAAKIRECLRRPETWLADGVIEATSGDPERWQVTVRALGYEMANVDVAIAEETDGLRLTAHGPDGGSYNGRIRLRPAPDQLGLEVHAAIRIEPGNALAAAVARSIEGVAARALGHALHRFRQLIEAGEIARADLQPHGRRGVVARTVKAVARRREAAA